MPFKLSEKAILKLCRTFEDKGPYTADEVLRISRLLEGQDDEDFDGSVVEALSDFPAPELALLFKYLQNSKEYIVLHKLQTSIAVHEFHLTQFNDVQMAVLADQDDWDTFTELRDTSLFAYKDLRTPALELMRTAAIRQAFERDVEKEKERRLKEEKKAKRLLRDEKQKAKRVKRSYIKRLIY